MKNKLLLRTNLVVCSIIILGFAVTSFISYRSSQGIFEQDVERVSSQFILSQSVQSGFSYQNSWVVPADAEKPKDARIKSGKYIKRENNLSGVKRHD